MEMSCESVKSYALKVDGSGNVVGEHTVESLAPDHQGHQAQVAVNFDRADEKLHNLVLCYASDHNVGYEQAFECVIADPANDRIVQAYARS